MVTTAEFMDVLRRRARAFGSGEPVHDLARRRTYMPDGSVVPFLSAPTARSLHRARDCARRAGLERQ